ncbi:diguanylate cyclase (GGDEF)-like protein [Tamilnaduibacter salinus]|uniref:diguanylate cyclase n=2 Tax=Tamilnaduibacter salinus TaxID=1484056 RepID=A0A2U1CX82_9GAMM|nr:diguanylate cyclase (GGDEF)-like protein [Tamilnaduibacter salinus]
MSHHKGDKSSPPRPATMPSTENQATHLPPGAAEQLLDNMDVLVYVADMETHELLYVNEYGRAIWGEPRGRHCWEVLQNRTSPCPFCTNDQLVDDRGIPSGPHVWEFRNESNHRWYQCRDRAMRWPDGRLVRMEVATDITERKAAEEAAEEARRRADSLAREDVLTGLNNRRAFLERADLLLAAARRHQQPVAAILLDLDWFKHINDQYGHGAGDVVLQAVGEVIRSEGRQTDPSGRLGGEEFAIVMADASVDQARTLAERLRRRLAALAIESDGACLSVTASFGVATLSDPTETISTLLGRADQAMYRAKLAGRNRVEVA